ncbi:MAG TPA: cytochrome c biogenesis protein CcdA, partial [Candidatus Omnitrophota bacterium]|nr:cytochrome c biogenesis protein CcdA [Candidatus Omnitrophota bacterium]
VGPCTAPVLSSILLYIGSKQNVLMGVFLMFVFSYGVGASLIIVGTFSGILGSLPKSGAWLLWIKRACGAVFLLAAAYFFYQFLYRVNG